MPEPINVEPREGYRIWVEYDDGASGEVDLSDVAGKGVFKPWLEREFFEQVHISEYGAITWSDDLDICPDTPDTPDTPYFDLTGNARHEPVGDFRTPTVPARDERSRQ